MLRELPIVKHPITTTASPYIYIFLFSFELLLASSKFISDAPLGMRKNVDSTRRQKSGCCSVAHIIAL